MSKSGKLSKETLLTIIGVVIIFFFRFLPAPSGLVELDMQIAGIFIGTIFLWLFVSTSWPSIIVIAALIMTPLYTTAQGLAASMGSWVTSFVLFSSMCTYALTKTGFLRRCAIWFITRPVAKNKPWLFLALFFLGPLVVGSFMSPLPTFIVFAAIAEQIYLELGYKKGDRFPQMVHLVILGLASLSTATTPIAHSVPILGFSLYEQDTGMPIDFTQYTIFGIAISVVIYFAFILIMKYIFKPDLDRIRSIDTDFLTKDLKPMGAEEKTALIIFGIVVLFWMLPGIVRSAFPNNALANYWNTLGAAVPPLLGTVALCLVHVKGKPIMDMGESIKAAPWVAVMMVAGTMLLGNALTHSDIGLTSWIVSILEPFVKGLSPMMFVFIVSMFVVIMTNFASNTVTVTVTYSFVLPLIYSGVIGGVNPAALTCVIGAGASLALATPPATGHAAVAVGTGWLKNEIMFKYGMTLAIIQGLVLAFIGYPIAAAIMPF